MIRRVSNRAGLHGPNSAAMIAPEAGLYPWRILAPSAGLAAVVAVALFPATTFGQSYVDAISRELTVRVAPQIEPTDAVSRELSLAVNLGGDSIQDAVARALTVELDPDGEEPVDAVAREVALFVGMTYVTITSSGPAQATPVFGSLPAQLATLNAPPPSFDPNAWLPVHRQNSNLLENEFLCDSVPDPLAQSYVVALKYIDEMGVAADEVTLDNCSSAFYRFAFTLPDDAVVSTARLTGSANVDQQGVAWLNSTRLSGLMSTPGCTPIDPTDPLDPCYLQQDAWNDRVDADGKCVLTLPTLDPFETPGPGAFIAGENVLIFAVAGDAQPFEPTGVEFAAAVLYAKRGDVDCNGQVDFFDIDPFVASLGGANAYGGAYPYCHWLTADMDCDGDVDFFDIDPFVACLSGDCACP